MWITLGFTEAPEVPEVHGSTRSIVKCVELPGGPEVHGVRGEHWIARSATEYVDHPERHGVSWSARSTAEFAERRRVHGVLWST